MTRVENSKNIEKLNVLCAINSTTLTVGATETLAPVALGEEGNKVEDVKFSFLSSDKDIVTVNEAGVLTAVAEGQAEITVATTNAVENVEKTITVTVVKSAKEEDYSIALTVVTKDEDLIADGATIMIVEAALEGPAAETATGMLTFKSKRGLTSAQAEAAMQNGKARFNVKLPNSKIDLTDEISVEVKSNDALLKIEKNELVGTTSGNKSVQYLAAGAQGEQGPTTYSVDRVGSADVADRVVVYVGNVVEANVEKVGEAIVEQVQVTNKANFTNAIDLVKVMETTKVTGGYAYTVLVELPENANDTTNILHDNQYNYYRVSDKTDKQTEDKVDVVLLKLEANAKNRFMLIDGIKPEVRDVKTSTDDKEFLQENSLLVVFSEAVNKKTAEKESNYVINGNTLSAADVKSIEVLDYDTKLELTAIEKGKERNSVLIELNRSAVNRLLDNGENLLQAKSIADWAGMTDLSDNNKITTQDFTFDYIKPEVKPGLMLHKESPEQFLLGLEEELYKATNATNEIDLENKELKVELMEKGKDESDDQILLLDKDTDYNLVKLNKEKVVNGVRYTHILELKTDWTKLLTEGKAYHHQDFKISIDTDAKVYDIDGTEVERKMTEKEGSIFSREDVLTAVVNLPEDTKSPTIAESKVYGRDIVAKKDQPEIVVDGKTEITMSEPVQLVKDSAGTNTLMKINGTPSTEQADGIPVPSFEYVKVKTVGEDDLFSAGDKVTGEITSGENYDQHDMIFNVEPKGETLDAGDWKLVVRQISDDVGNTMATEEISFTVETDDLTANIVDPYVVWSFAEDDVTLEDGTTKDFVHILYSRHMSIDAIRSATYSINGKVLDQDAKITRTRVPVYNNVLAKSDDDVDYHKNGAKSTGNEDVWEAELVSIELPEDFMILSEGKDTVALTIPRSLKAIADTNEETLETLLFDNNGGSNQFEISTDANKTFETGNEAADRKDLNLPVFTVSDNSKYFTALAYSGSIKGSRTAAIESALDDAKTELGTIDTTEEIVKNAVDALNAMADETAAEKVAKTNKINQFVQLAKDAEEAGQVLEDILGE